MPENDTSETQPASGSGAAAAAAGAGYEEEQQQQQKTVEFTMPVVTDTQGVQQEEEGRWADGTAAGAGTTSAASMTTNADAAAATATAATPTSSAHPSASADGGVSSLFSSLFDEDDEDGEPRIDLDTGVAVDRRQSIAVVAPGHRRQGTGGGLFGLIGAKSARRLWDDALGGDDDEDGDAHGGVAVGGDVDEEVPPTKLSPTFRIRSRNMNLQKSRGSGFWGCLCGWYDWEHSCSLTLMMNNFLRWTFRATFLEVGIVSYLAFLVLILFFAMMTYWIGRYRPQCLSVAGANFDEDGTMYMDA